MKSFFTLMVTILIYSLSFAQNSNDCNITLNKQDYQNFILQDYNANAKSINDFISIKKKERDQLKRMERIYGTTTDKDEDKYNPSQSQSSFERFSELRDYLIRSLPYNDRDGNKYLLASNQYSDIAELKILIRQNLEHSETNQKIIKGIDAVKMELKPKENTYAEQPQLYTTDIEKLEELTTLLYEVNITDFNTCAEIINQNLQNIESDIRNAENKLNEITSINLSEFEFKKNITLIVGILIGIILISFFTGVLYKATDTIKQKLIGETGLQFITIFVIIIAVILFGVMNILKGSELAAILSAIAGYILGKTAPPKSDKTLEIELEILRLKSLEADRLKQEEAIKKKEEEKRELEIEAEDKRLESEEIHQKFEELTGNEDEDSANIDENSIENDTQENIEEDPTENADESNDDLDDDQNRNK